MKCETFPTLDSVAKFLTTAEAMAYIEKHKLDHAVIWEAWGWYEVLICSDSLVRPSAAKCGAQ